MELQGFKVVSQNYTPKSIVFIMFQHWAMATLHYTWTNLYAQDLEFGMTRNTDTVPNVFVANVSNQMMMVNFSRMRSEGFPFIVWGSGGWTFVRLQLLGASLFGFFASLFGFFASFFASLIPCL